MRKLFAVFLALSALLLYPESSQAGVTRGRPLSEFYFLPTIGIDYQFVHANYQSAYEPVLADTMHGVHLHFGARIHKHMGVELGYMWTDQAEKNDVLGSGLTTKTSIDGVTFDVLGYLPLGRRVEAIGTAGLSYLNETSRINAGGFSTLDESEIGARFGGGFQYWLTGNVNFRALLRYQTMDFNNTADGGILGNAGFNYQL